MARRVTVPDDSVFEGYGHLYTGNSEVSPSAQTRCVHDNGGVLNCCCYCSAGDDGGSGSIISLDREEATRQRREALGVDVFPKLVKCFPREIPLNVAVSSLLPPRYQPFARPSSLPLLGQPHSTSSGFRYEIGRLNSLCRVLRDWLMCHEKLEERVAEREFVRTTERLLQRRSVDELLCRTDGLRQELDTWPAVLDATGSQIGGWGSSTAIPELHEFVKEVLQTDEVCKRLAELTRRFFLVAPLVEEAALQSAALEEITRCSSEVTLSSLQTLRDSIREWGLQVEDDRQNLLASTQMLLDRCEVVVNKRGRKLA